MANQPRTPRSQQSRNQAPPVGMTGMGTDPSGQPNPDTEFKQPNVAGQQGAQRHEDMFTKTKPEDARGGVADQTDRDVAELTAEQEAALRDAPTADEDFDPDAVEGEEVAETDVQEEDDSDEDVLVRLLHEEGPHHINMHPLEPGTVVSMKRGEFRGHQERGMLAEEVGDDYDGEVYDTSETWKPEVKEEA